jgi:hypothetical protein
MATLNDLTVEEFQKLVSSTVQEAFDHALESLEASRSEEYRASIREARADYEAGRVVGVDDLMDDD